jgi:hypothetical protein
MPTWLLACPWQVNKVVVETGEPPSDGWEMPAKLLGRMVAPVVAASSEGGQPGRGRARGGGPPLVRPEDCVRLVEAFLLGGPGLASPAVRAHHAACGHVVRMLVQLACEGMKASGARAAVALCGAATAAFHWLLAGGRGQVAAGPAKEEGQARVEVEHAAEVAVELLWGYAKDHGARLVPPTGPGCTVALQKILRFKVFADGPWSFWKFQSI